VAADDDPKKDEELHSALQTVKDEIVYKANEIKREKRWVKDVTKIIESYIKKTRRVQGNIRKLQNEIKVLFRKKKQLENMIVQRALEKKLKVAHQDLDTIKQALTSVKKKQSAFSKSKKDIRDTMKTMEQMLQKLRGERGGESSSSSGSSSSSSSN